MAAEASEREAGADSKERCLQGLLSLAGQKRGVRALVLGC